jgi:hypothetical protein
MAATKECQQCGRVGTRGFTTIPAQTVNVPAAGGPVDLPEFTECANRAACARRWPKHPKDDD